MIDRDVGPVPILPLNKLEDLPALLQSHAAALTRAAPQSAVPATPIQLLAHCTASPSLSQEAAHFVSDLFPSLRELARACTSQNSAPASSAGMLDFYEQSDPASAFRLQTLRDLVGAQMYHEIVSFWREDRVR